MRSKDSYHGNSRSTGFSLIIAAGSVVPLVAMLSGTIMSAGKLSPKLGAPQGMLAFLGLTVVAVVIGFGIVLLLIRWKQVRSYNAWKATFEEEWKPKPRYFEKMKRVVSISPGLALVKQSLEV
jgi:H+/gluconate symporter-like permease